jgi:spore germination cell wall hydrolase CwlJ-like protein
MILSRFFVIFIILFYSLFANAESDVECLAKNIYFEARGEPLIGKLSVGFVTLNRVKSKQFPNTICEVVKQRRKNTCQFSWFCDGLSDKPKDLQLYKSIVDIADNFMYYYIILKDPTHGALFYHNTSINGGWFKRNLTQTTQHNGHIFYK